MADNIPDSNTEEGGIPEDDTIRKEIISIKEDISELYEKIINISHRLEGIEQHIIISNIKQMQYDINSIKDVVNQLHTQSTNITENVNKITQTNEILTQRQLNRALRKSAISHGVPGIPFVRQKTPY